MIIAIALLWMPPPLNSKLTCIRSFVLVEATTRWLLAALGKCSSSLPQNQAEFYLYQNQIYERAAFLVLIIEFTGEC